MLLAGHEKHVADADPLQQLQRVVHHRPAPDGEQMLVRDAGQLLQARRAPPRADQSFHAADGTGSVCPKGRPRTAAAPASPATTDIAATAVHIVVSPQFVRTCRPRNGPSAQATAHELPKKPM